MSLMILNWRFRSTQIRKDVENSLTKTRAYGPVNPISPSDPRLDLGSSIDVIEIARLLDSLESLLLKIPVIRYKSPKFFAAPAETGRQE